MSDAIPFGRDPAQAMVEEFLRVTEAEEGHFVFESGHHGSLWLNLDALFADALRTRRWAALLAGQVRTLEIDFVCGPSSGGAFLAQLLALEMRCGFLFAERNLSATRQASYAISRSMRQQLKGKRVLLVDDAIQAGSAMRSTLLDLDECEAHPAAMAALVCLGDGADRLARERGLPLFRLAAIEHELWESDDCPLCAKGRPVDSMSL